MKVIENFMFENIAGWTVKKIKDYKTVIIASILSALMAYMFWFTNKLVNHDDIKALFDLGIGVSSGRWMIDVMAKLTITASLPWLNGVVGIFLITAANCLIVDMFHIKNRVVQVMLAALIMVFPGNMDVFTYMFTSTAYCLAFLFSAMSAWFFNKGGWKNIMIGVASGILMLATYQPYVTVISTLLLLSLVQDIIENRNSALEILFRGIKCLLYLVAVVFGYFAVTMLIFLIIGGGLNSYATAHVSSGKNIFQRIAFTYQAFFDIIFKRKLNIVNNAYSSLVHIGSLAIILFEMGLTMFRSKDIRKAGLMLVCIILLPLSMNAMYLVFEDYGIRAMMSFGFIGMYVAAAVFLDNISWTKQRLIKEALMWFLALAIINNVCIANKTALRMHLAYENAHSFFTTVLADIKMTPGFDENCKIALIGYTDVHVYPIKELGNDNVNGALKDLINEYSREAFIAYFCGFDAEYANDQEEAEIMETEEFKSMPRYPYYGSIKRIGDYLVVKLDEIPLYG